jgi:hypothetical protein
MRLTARAHARPCPRCGAATVRGLTEPPAAWTAVTDPIPLGPAEEIQALLSGRMTYDLVTIGRHCELIARDQFRITRRDHPVLATHQCPGPVPWANIPPQRIEEKNDDGPCPY